jgi:hypothetical protein
MDQFIALDDTGSGSTTFDLSSLNLNHNVVADGYVGLSGRCGTHGDGVSSLFGEHEPDCPQCATDGYGVHFDGGAPVVGPKYAKPAAPKQTANENCATYIPKRLETLPPGTEFALSTIKGADIGLYLQVTCALVNVASSDNPLDDQNVFNSACKILENATDPLSIGASKDFFCGTPAG